MSATRRYSGTAALAGEAAARNERNSRARSEGNAMPARKRGGWAREKKALGFAIRVERVSSRLQINPDHASFRESHFFGNKSQESSKKGLALAL